MATATATQKIVCAVDGLRSALAFVKGVIPTRSPKPIILKVVFAVDPEGGSTLLATDLELSIRADVAGVEAAAPVRLVLPPGKLESILADPRERNGDKAETVTFTAHGDGTVGVKAGRASYELPTDDPDTFPDVPVFTHDAYFEVEARDLKKLIKRTHFATDAVSVRYGISGCLFHLEKDTLYSTATDGRRVAKQGVGCKAVADAAPPPPPEQTILPVKTLKLLDRITAEGDPPVHMHLSVGAAAFRTGSAVVTSRLVSGRFPDYASAMEGAWFSSARFTAGALLSACREAEITTGIESHGVLFEFSPGPAMDPADGSLTLRSQAADVGSGVVEMGVRYEGEPLSLRFDPRFLIDALQAVGGYEEMTLTLNEHGEKPLPNVLRTGDGYKYGVMSMDVNQPKAEQ